MKALRTGIVMGVTLVSLVGCSTNKDNKNAEKKGTVSSLKEDFSKKRLDKHITDWPDASKKATDFLVNKYGLPDTVGENMLVWNDTGDFKKTIVFNEEIQHDFPMPHTDVMEQSINYKAPKPQKVAEVWKYDGSVHLRRTEGEMSARCDQEAANYLALNLANDIIEGKKTVEEARMAYGREIMNMKNGNPGKLTQKLTFSPASAEAGEPDKSIMDKIKNNKSKQAQEAAE